MRTRSKVFRTIAVIAALSGFGLVAAAQSTNSQKISIDMHQARVHALQAVDDFELLQTYSMAGIPWQVHYSRLQKIQDEVRALGKDAARLNLLKDDARFDQQIAIERVNALSTSLAIRVGESLHYLNRHTAAVNKEPFALRVRSQYDSSKEIFSILCQCARKADRTATQISSDGADAYTDATAAADCSRGH